MAGFWKGIGEGTLKNRVPEAHTDYIISVISEEFGVISIILILFIFLSFIYLVFKKLILKIIINQTYFNWMYKFDFNASYYSYWSEYKIVSYYRYDFTIFKLWRFINCKCINFIRNNFKFNKKKIRLINCEKKFLFQLVDLEDM